MWHWLIVNIAHLLNQCFNMWLYVQNVHKNLLTLVSWNERLIMTSLNTKCILPTIAISVLLIVAGCGDKDFEAGMYWLNKENNPTMAARAFQRSLQNRPGHWKTNKMALETLSLSENIPEFEKQIISTLHYWPDSSRSASLYRPAVSLLGEERYNQLSAPIAQQHLGNLIGEKGDRPDILSSIIMASCRMKDTVAANDYFKRLMSSIGGENAPDSVIQELGFLIGPAGVDWVQMDWKIAKNPDDIDARLAQLDAGLIVGDSIAVRRKLTELVARLPNATADPKFARKFGRLVGVDPFASKTVVKGWDGSRSLDGKSIVYIKDLGRDNEPDQYIYKATSNGSQETPLMKGLQQVLPSLAWPMFSPNNKWVYFYGSPNRNWSPGRSVGRFHLYRIRARYGSRPQKMTDADLLPVTPHFGNDGSLLLVKRDVGSTRASVEVVMLNPEKCKLEILSRIGEPVTGAVFTPSGDSLIFTTDRGIFRRSVNGGKLSVDLAKRGLFYPQISPDGKQLLVLNRRNQALLIDRSTGEFTFIGRTPTPLCSFDKDGNLLLTQVINGQRHIVKLDLNRRIETSEQFLTAIRQ